MKNRIKKSKMLDSDFQNDFSESKSSPFGVLNRSFQNCELVVLKSRKGGFEMVSKFPKGRFGGPKRPFGIQQRLFLNS